MATDVTEIAMSDGLTSPPGAGSTEHRFPPDDGPFVYSEEDVERARALPADACPRRYCFHWDSPSFHWERSPREGCLFLVGKKIGWKYAGIPCCRSETSSIIDHFEPNEWAAEADGVDFMKWGEKSIENHRRADEFAQRMGLDDLGSYLRSRLGHGQEDSPGEKLSDAATIRDRTETPDYASRPASDYSGSPAGG
jgi:hypothetical protein